VGPSLPSFLARYVAGRWGDFAAIPIVVALARLTRPEATGGFLETVASVGGCLALLHVGRAITGTWRSRVSGL
jgi:hypothetical protein